MFPHDITPNPKGARPVAPMPDPICPHRDLPHDRSEFTREAEGTGL